MKLTEIDLLYDENKLFIDQKLHAPFNDSEIKLNIERSIQEMRKPIVVFGSIPFVIFLILATFFAIIVAISNINKEVISVIQNGISFMAVITIVTLILLIIGGALMMFSMLIILTKYFRLYVLLDQPSISVYKNLIKEGSIVYGRVNFIKSVENTKEISYTFISNSGRQYSSTFITRSNKSIDTGNTIAILHGHTYGIIQSIIL